MKKTKLGKEKQIKYYLCYKCKRKTNKMLFMCEEWKQ